jgi:DNA uptake protein ComE-like DNA-binding protein
MMDCTPNVPSGASKVQEITMTFDSRSRWSNLAWLACVAAAVFASGCGYFQVGGSDAAAQKVRDEKTREEVAKATENAKPALEEAGRKVGEVAKTAAEDARAAAEGVKEGWDRGGHAIAVVDVNSASESDLAGLPGISHRDARKIIANRPYGNKHDLVAKGVLTEDQYQSIRNGVAAK